MKIVGHSLGAGTAAIIAVLLKERYVIQRRRGQRSFVPFIPAVGFGCPPCMDIPTSEACREDKLVYNLVHRSDIVPRLSEANMIPLAEEVVLYKDVASRYFDDDKAALKENVRTLGKGGRLGEEEERTLPNVSSDSKVHVVDVFHISLLYLRNPMHVTTTLT